MISHMIRTKRACHPPDAGDGPRFLVDRLCPWEVGREELKPEGWLKNEAPSEELRE